MLAQMSPRERNLALLVGGVLVILVNVVLFKFFLQKRTEFQVQIAKSEGQINGLKQKELQRTLWSERDAWLTQNLPTLGDTQVANRELSEFVKELAKKHTVTVETPNPGTPLPQKDYTALGIRVTAKAPWQSTTDAATAAKIPPLVEFLRELQAPGNFIVLDPLDLKVDPTDKTQLRAEVTVTKWYAPKQAL
jgi:hypothetical protein